MVSLYQIRNTVNGKLYFGKTSQPVATRWRKHRNAASAGAELALSRAIRKYGPHSFDVTALFTVDSEEEANAAERNLIATHKSNSPANGYNLTVGGDGISSPSDDLRQRRYVAQLAGIQAYLARTPDRAVWGRGKPVPNVRTDISTDVVVNLYVAGKSPRQISKLLGFDGVLRRLRSAGVHIRTRAEVQLGRPRAN